MTIFRSIRSTLPFLSFLASTTAAIVASLTYWDAQAVLTAKRPWVNLDVKEGLRVIEKLTVTDGAARIRIELPVVRNGGDSAAAGTSVFYRHLEMGTAPKNIELVATKMKGACDSTTLHNKAEVGELILPGQEVSLGEYLFSTTAVQMGPAWFVGCIGYRDARKNRYATSFYYAIDADGSVRRMNGLSAGGY